LNICLPAIALALTRPARNALARLPRELLASGQACEAGG